MHKELLDKLRCITTEEQAILDGAQTIDTSIYMGQEASIVDCSRLLEHGKLITVRPHTRFIHFPKHTHNYIEVIYVCSGELVQLINGEEVRLEQGELLFLNQSATQEILPAGLDDIAVNLIILPQFFDQTLLMLGKEENQMRDFLIGCLQEKCTDVPYLHFKVANVLPVQNLVENLIDTLVNQQPNKRSINQITMGLLILQLLNHTDKMSMGQNTGQQDLMFAVLRFVEENYQNGELTELANRLHYDVSWLSREIKQSTGKNYTDLVQAKRLSQAAFLLHNTTMTTAQIGNLVGYDNLSYFYRIFALKFNMTPKQFRSTKL